MKFEKRKLNEKNTEEKHWHVRNERQKKKQNKNTGIEERKTKEKKTVEKYWGKKDKREKQKKIIEMWGKKEKGEITEI